MKSAADAGMRLGGALRRARAALVACALVAGALRVQGPVQGQRSAVAGSLPLFLTRVTGLPPHQAWPLPNNAQSEWIPFALDGHTVLMIWSPGFNPRKVRLSFVPGPLRMAIAHVGSTVLTPIPPGAYPHFGLLNRWRIEGSWIVGIVYTTPGMPRDWRLWAGNIQTGASMVLDHANPGPGPSDRTPPDFSLDRGRVAWNYAYITPDRRFHSKIALYDLRRRTLSFVAPSPLQREAAYQKVALSGGVLVWTQITPAAGRDEHPTLDLLRYDLDTGTLTNLTENWQKPGSDGSGASDEPDVSGHLLVFKQAPSPFSSGDIILADLRKISSPLWRDRRSFQVLDRYGEAPEFGDGLLVWITRGMATSAVMDLACRRIWTIQDPALLGKQAYKDVWQVQFVSGRSMIVQRTDPSGRNPAFFVWTIPPHPCT